MKNIVVGNDLYIGYSCWINGIGGGITFEDEVILGPYVKMGIGNHAFFNGSARYASAKSLPIKIGYGSWLATNKVITS